jgi:anti-anti-sigma regulatory factor
VIKGFKKDQRKINMASHFKYYIHDTAQGLSLELAGPFTEASVAELACCWRTAKSTLGSRSLTLDLRRVTSVDESARQWLASMAQDGARHQPESFLLETLAGLDRSPQSFCDRARTNFFGRIFRLAARTSA